MRKLIASEFITLDSSMEALEKWSFQFRKDNDELGKFKHDELFASDTLLLGRLTYQTFADSWPSRTGEFADRMNNIQKYVVSRTLKKLTWNNSHLVKENVVEEISILKKQPGRDILVAGSGVLVQTLMQHDLVDEYRLMIHPIVLGDGKHLFKDGSSATLKLVRAQPFRTGIVLLEYKPEKNLYK
jgi:dihydrofolate reductase